VTLEGTTCLPGDVRSNLLPMVAMTSGDIEARVSSLFDQLTREEKASLTGGADLWHLPPIARLGIGRLMWNEMSTPRADLFRG
jgi:hypothetical protein